MKSLKVLNLTDESQTLLISEGNTRRLHTISVLAHGSFEISLSQVTGDLKSKVNSEIFKVTDSETGEVFSFDRETTRTAQEPPSAPEPQTVDTGEEETRDESKVEEQLHVCDVCDEKFETARALSSHKRSHK